MLDPVRHVIHVPGYHPTRLNKLLGRHWGKAHSLKGKDKEIIGKAMLAHGTPVAKTPRRVAIYIVLGQGVRAGDGDAYFKSLLDALVHHGALKEDNRQWCQLEPVVFLRGPISETFIILEDIVT